jgi:orotidine-5'-phosphate decarboxylase
MTTERIILALDVNDPAYALQLVDRFREHIRVFKVGLELFSYAGPDIINEIHRKGKKVFLDLKFHDIPNTVTRAAVAATRTGVHMFNLHTSGGLDAMKRCKDAVHEICAKEQRERPKLLGVTVLTSLSQEALKAQFGIQHSLRTHVKHLSSLAREAGLDGVVASGHEVSMIKKNCGKDFLCVTPGIRPSWSPPDDQSRTMTPRQAIKEGADYLVVGRSILEQQDPLEALDLIVTEMLTA